MLTDVLNGVSFGGVLFILAAGFSLALGVGRIINIAHGAFYMLAVYVAVTLEPTVGFLGALGIVTMMLGVIGGGLQLAILRRFEQRVLPQVLSTFGVLLIIVELTLLIWGGFPRQLNPPELLSGSIQIGNASITSYRIFLIGIAILLFVALHVVVNRTLTGAKIRAAVDDAEMARASGIEVNRLLVGVMGASGALAGMAGGLGGVILGTYQNVQFTVLTLTLVVVVLGGVGTLAGALIGSMVVGILYSVGVAILPQYAYFILFGPMVVILAVRPKGLLSGMSVEG